MAWTTLSFDDPTSSAAGVDKPVRVVTVDPWTEGVAEGEGHHRWLSFPNAVDGVVDRLNWQQGEAVFAIGVGAGSIKSLAAKLDQLALALPFKPVLQWARRANALATLNETKYFLPSPIVGNTGSTLSAFPLVKARMIKDMSTDAAANTVSASDDPLLMLTSFETEKAAFDAELSTPVEPVPNYDGDAVRFYADADIKAAMHDGALGANRTHSAIIAWVASPNDLAFLVEMMP